MLSSGSQTVEAASWIRNANIHLTIETSEATKSGINRVRPVSGSHDDNIGASLHAIHQGKKLGHDTSLNFTVGLDRKSVV